MLKRKKHQDEKEEGFIKKLFQRVKEISFYSYMLSFLIAVLLLILFLIYSENRNRDLKVPQTVVQSQIEIVPKEKFSKNEEVYLNETAKSNLKNFDVFISKKSPNTGLFLIRPSDIVSKKDTIVLSDSVNSIELSGSEEILKNLEWSLSTASKSIITPNSIKIELNSKENIVLTFNLKNLELLGEYLNSNSPLLSVTYTESYAE